LEDVLSREKLSLRLTSADVTPHNLVLGYAALASVIVPARITPVIVADPGDDEVIASAIAAQAKIIVSGDRHLLGLEQYEDIRILTSAQLIAELS
jgi:uncharacterized protein